MDQPQKPCKLSWGERVENEIVGALQSPYVKILVELKFEEQLVRVHTNQAWALETTFEAGKQLQLIANEELSKLGLESATPVILVTWHVKLPHYGGITVGQVGANNEGRFKLETLL